MTEDPGKAHEPVARKRPLIVRILMWLVLGAIAAAAVITGAF